MMTGNTARYTDKDGFVLPEGVVSKLPVKISVGVVVRIGEIRVFVDEGVGVEAGVGTGRVTVGRTGESR